MADQLYLSVWFPSFEEEEILPRLLAVVNQVPFSAQRPGIRRLSIHPVSWSEPEIIENTFLEGGTPEEAAAAMAEFLHSDYAYEVEAMWDLWTPEPASPELDERARLDALWKLKPQPVRFVAHGLDFDDGAFREQGHVLVDLGLDELFLYESLELTPDIEDRVKANVKKLVDFTSAIETQAGIRGRVLWSESEENLAQKLISRLQGVQ